VALSSLTKRTFKGEAFAPGHITGFFEICDESDNVLKKGSRGAGLCLDKGVMTKVTLTEASDDPARKIFLNGKPSKAPVTRKVIDELAPGHDAVVKSTHDFPIGQGLGMSAAGALSTAIAIADALGLPREKAVHAAHAADVISRTGLGDVGPAAQGGMTIRLRPGIPPFGQIRSIPIDGDVEILVAMVGPPMSKPKILTDPARRRAINQAGKDCVDKMSRNPTLDNLLTLSRGFAEKCGLMDNDVRTALKAVDRFGKASMSMIGSSIFAHGEDPGVMARALKRFTDEVYVCHVDNRGARIL
jgi:pantoate kinase